MEEPAPSGAGSFCMPTIWAVLATAKSQGRVRFPRRRAAARGIFQALTRGDGCLPSLECQEMVDRRLT
jgi:hypothetical protein